MSANNEKKESKNKFTLQGRVNYLQWRKRFEGFAALKGWMSPELKIKEETSNDVKEWLLENLSDEVMLSYDSLKTAQENLDQLGFDYGFGHLNSDNFLRTIQEGIDFPVSRNPLTVFQWLDLELLKLSCCDEKNEINDNLKCNLLWKGLVKGTEKKLFKTDDFWFTCRGNLNRMAKSYKDWKLEIYQFWDAFRSPNVSVDDSKFQPEPTKKELKREEANHVDQRAKKRQKQGEKHCDYCAKFDERKRIKNTHNTDSCFFGDKAGKERISESTGNHSF